MPCMLTGGRVRHATRRLVAIALLGSLAGLCAEAGAPAADVARFPASVAWVHDDLVYLAAPDSGTLLAGMTLAVERRHRRLARVTVTRLLEPRLAVARTDSGTVT